MKKKKPTRTEIAVLRLREFIETFRATYDFFVDHHMCENADAITDWVGEHVPLIDQGLAQISLQLFSLTQQSAIRTRSQIRFADLANSVKRRLDDSREHATQETEVNQTQPQKKVPMQKLIALTNPCKSVCRFRSLKLRARSTIPRLHSPKIRK